MSKKGTKIFWVFINEKQKTATSTKQLFCIRIVGFEKLPPQNWKIPSECCEHYLNNFFLFIFNVCNAWMCCQPFEKCQHLKKWCLDFGSQTPLLLKWNRWKYRVEHECANFSNKGKFGFLNGFHIKNNIEYWWFVIVLKAISSQIKG